MLRQGCSLSMLHRTCEKVQGVLGWVDWACPISCAYIFILSPGVLRSTLFHIWCKGELTYISIRCAVFNSNIYWFFNSSGNAMVLPPYYLEVILSGGMACIVSMVVYRGRFLQVFFESFSKGPRGLPYVFLITCKVPTLELVDGPTFVFHGVLVFGRNQEVFNCTITFEVGLYAIPITDLFDVLA